MPHRDVGASHEEGISVDRLIGELIAETRMTKHGLANVSQKLDAISSVVAQNQEILHRMATLERDRDTHHTRLAVLEADKNRREGAVGLVEWFARHWPLSLVAGAIAFLVAWANGKVGG